MTANPDSVIRDRIDHLSIGVREPAIVLEEVAMPVDVRHHELLIHEWIATHQIGITRIIIDHEFVDLCQSVGILLL